jgi:hypothetical protein
LLAEGRLLEPTAWERCSLFDVNFQPLRMSPGQLQHEALELGRRLYTEEARTARRHRFHDQRLRHLRAARQSN